MTDPDGRKDFARVYPEPRNHTKQHEESMHSVIRVYSRNSRAKFFFSAYAQIRGKLYLPTALRYSFVLSLLNSLAMPRAARTATARSLSTVSSQKRRDRGGSSGPVQQGKQGPAYLIFPSRRKPLPASVRPCAAAARSFASSPRPKDHLAVRRRFYFDDHEPPVASESKEIDLIVRRTKLVVDRR